MAYELLAGAHPFADRTTPQELLVAQLGETPVMLSRRVPELSPAIGDLVRRCLEKNPARRPRTARDILDVLNTVTTPPARSVPLIWRARGGMSRNVLAGAGLIVLALVAYMATVRITGRSTQPEPVGTQSLAVLPFEAVGGDTANAYFGDGIADEIAAALSRVGGLRVASRTAATALRANHTVDVRELGR